MEPLLVGLGITLLPIYAFESGTVQYAHMVLAVWMLLRFSHQRSGFAPAEILLILLTLLAFLVESLAVIVSSASTSSLIEPAYFAFNTAIVIAFARLPMNETSFRFAVIGSVIASTFIATASAWYYGASLTVLSSGFERSTGLFNNPNQQGYFAVCVGSIAGLLYLRNVISRNVALLLWLVSMVLAMASVSRASSSALVVLLAFGCASLINKQRLSPAVLIGAVAFLAGIWVAYDQGLLNSFQFIERIRDTGSARYDSFTARGYTIPFHDPISFLFGVGAQHARIGSIFHPLEVHSTFWSFVGKYGLIGFSLWIGVWLIWTRGIFRELGLLGVLIVILPHVVNGISQNNSRVTALYILIGLSLNKTFARVSDPRRDKSSRPPVGFGESRPNAALAGPYRDVQHG